jgi:hypothetical protein
MTDDTEKACKAILDGRIEFTPRVKAALQSMDLENPDHTITGVQVLFWGPFNNNQGGMGIDWMTKSAGCGRADFYIKDGKLHCMNEAMSKQFVATLLDFMLEHTEWDE